MADRYWVGGAGTWDATTTTNWSATSGGAGGASAPTSADNAIFNSASNATAYAVTVGTNAVAADITIAGPVTGNVTITWLSTSVINCYGSWFNAASGVAHTSSATGGALNFLATTTGKTVNTNGVAIAATLSPNINFNGASGGWTLTGSGLTFTGILSVTQGAFDTGSFNITAAVFQSSGTNVRSVSLGSSTITLNTASPWNFSTTTNLTFNAGTSTIICSNATPTFAGGGLTYNNVQFTSTAGGNTTTITGNNTFNNLSQTSPTSNRRDMSIGANQTVTGTFTPGAANQYSVRVRVQSSGAGSPVTLTVATVATLSDVDFRDINAAGTSAPWSGTRLGNGLGNTNITFAVGKTVYWNLVAGGNWSANAWALSSGGSVSTANFPLAQDTVIIDNTGLTTSNTITMDAPWWLGTLTVTRTNAWTFSGSSSPFIYGDATLTSVTTVSGAANFTFLGQGLTQTFTTNGVALTTGIIQQAVGGTLLLNGAVTCASTATVTLNNGTLNLNNYTLTTGLFNASNANVRAITTGTGSFTITGNNAAIWNTGNATNLTYTSGVPVVNATYSGATGTRTFSTSSLADRINLNVTAGTDIITPVSTFIVNNYNFTGFSGTLTNISTQVYGSLTLSTGMTLSGGANTFTFRSTSGPNNITSNGKTMDFPITFDGVGGSWACQDALTLGPTQALTMINGTLQLASGVTSTVGSFVTSGTNQKYLQSTTPGWQATLSDASGTNTVTYLTIRDIVATGGATWTATAATNSNAGNNYGWTFSSTPISYGPITMGLRSFTQFRG